MTTVAICVEDIVIGRAQGIVGPEIPADLLALDDTRLRFNGEVIVDVGTAARTFYIDELGEKHLVDGSQRAPLHCAFDTEIEPDPNLGVWRLVDQFERLKERLKAAIDVEAERQRLRWITPGAGQAMTYARKVEQAKAVLAAQDPQPADYPMLAASIGIDGADLLTVANLIITMDQGWEQIGAAIEQARLSGKKAVDMAASIEAANAIKVIWPGA